MNPENLMTYLNNMGEEDDLSLCDLVCRPFNTDSAQRVQQELHRFVLEFRDARGWLCFQSTVEWFRSGELPDAGTVLYGEVAGDDDHTLIIRQDGNGGWLMIHMTEAPGRNHIAEECRHIGRDHPPGNLAYRRYWRHQPSWGFQPFAARFTGFQTGKGGIS